MSDLVLVKNNELLTTSLIIARELKRTHKSIINIIKEYCKSFEEFGIVGEFEMSQRHGKSSRIFNLNEPQVMFLITMLRVKQKELDIVLNFKIKITKEFFRMRKQLLLLATQKANQEWLEVRKKGKLTRLNETDVIKRYIEYAINQGSNTYLKNPNLAYSNITRMENKALFILEQKYPNIREMLDINQLDQIKQADSIVLKALNDGMIENMHYKKIYELAKTRIELFVSLIGKSIVPNIEFKEISNGR